MPLSDTPPNSPPRREKRLRWSLRTMLLAGTLLALVAGNALTIWRLQRAQTELQELRRQFGNLGDVPANQLAAVRVPTDTPLTYRFRVHTPSHTTPWSHAAPSASRYRIAYSTLLPQGKTQPDWYSAIGIPPGESVVTIRIAEDPRDERWKISTLVRSDRSNQRMGTILPDDHTLVFRQSHDVISTGVDRKRVLVAADASIRLLDERWLVGEQSLLLFGDKAPSENQIGVYAELQPADQPLP
ncbi:hypothetical protein [Neorhodopirellula lusitana]|uniref:hypothetical protein n=1 Tax=Neorhodopirellula lusitana TaxID=445327 RepID=UPI00384A71A1